MRQLCTPSTAGDVSGRRANIARFLTDRSEKNGKQVPGLLRNASWWRDDPNDCCSEHACGELLEIGSFPGSWRRCRRSRHGRCGCRGHHCRFAWFQARSIAPTSSERAPVRGLRLQLGSRSLDEPCSSMESTSPVRRASQLHAGHGECGRDVRHVFRLLRDVLSCVSSSPSIAGAHVRVQANLLLCACCCFSWNRSDAILTVPAQGWHVRIDDRLKHDPRCDS